MATLWKDLDIDAPVDALWAMLRDVGAADKAFAPVLTASRLDGDIRTVTFAGGDVVRERVITFDEAARRVAYTVIGGDFEHHSASMQALARPDGGCTFRWITDVLPDAAAERIRPLVELGSQALRAAVTRRG